MQQNFSKPVNRRRIMVVVANPLGGIRTYMLYNYRFLQSVGYQFTFIAPGNDSFRNFQEDVADWNGVEFIEVPVKKRKFSFRGVVRKELRKRRYDLIHSQGLRSGTETCFANLGIGTPHVITLHDVIVKGNDIDGKFQWLKKRIIGWLTSRADVIIPVSHDCAENHLQLFPEWNRGRCRIEIILNGVDVAKLEEAVAEVPDPRQLRETLGLSDDVLLLGFFGRFMPQKNFLFLLDTLSELAKQGLSSKIHLVATDDRNGYLHYRTEAQRSDLQKMVTLIDPVPNVATYLCQIDALVIPSQWEACPLLPMEGMVLGVPVIGSDCIGLREVLADTPASVSTTANVGSIVQEIDTMLHKKAQFQKNSVDYMPAARRRFDVANAVTKLQYSFNQLLGSSE